MLSGEDAADGQADAQMPALALSRLEILRLIGEDIGGITGTVIRHGDPEQVLGAVKLHVNFRLGMPHGVGEQVFQHSDM